MPVKNPEPSTSAEGRPAPGQIQQHPAERGERKQRYVVLYSCCCCCCCCLHTLGGAVGAALGGNFQAESDESVTPVKIFPSSQWLYWSSFLAATMLGIIAVAAYLFVESSSPASVATAPVIIGLTIVLFGPLWLLGASVVAAIRLSLRRNLPLRAEYWRQLGKITLLAIAGSIVGGLVMLLILSAFIR